MALEHKETKQGSQMESSMAKTREELAKTTARIEASTAEICDKLAKMVAHFEASQKALQVDMVKALNRHFLIRIGAILIGYTLFTILVILLINR